MINNRIKVTNRGMITIPAGIRKKYDIRDGKEFFLVDDLDGALLLVPFIDLEQEENRVDNEAVNEILHQMEQDRAVEIAKEFTDQ